jgi:hypothetical protein
VVVTPLGPCLMQTTPVRPMEHCVWWGQDAHDQPIDEPADLRDGEWNQGAGRRQLRHERPPLSALPGTRDRTTAR